MSVFNVTVIGAGTMGNGIAHVFAQKGFKVVLVDVQQAQLDKALQTIGKNLDRMISKGSITDAEKEETLNNIVTDTKISTGVSKAELVVEAATENEELKLKIFAEMDAAAPANAILASNTSSISINSFGNFLTISYIYLPFITKLPVSSILIIFSFSMND